MSIIISPLWIRDMWMTGFGEFSNFCAFCIYMHNFFMHYRNHDSDSRTNHAMISAYRILRASKGVCKNNLLFDKTVMHYCDASNAENVSIWWRHHVLGIVWGITNVISNAIQFLIIQVFAIVMETETSVTSVTIWIKPKGISTELVGVWNIVSMICSRVLSSCSEFIGCR